jgi:purine-nucleoside phosphorylase
MEFVDEEKMIDPREEIDYIRHTRFPNGELDSLPEFAIIIHDTRVQMFLDSLKILRSSVKKLETGITDLTILYVVRQGNMEFIITPGLTGASGVSTQIAELAAMGIKKVIHVGTCGVFSNSRIKYKVILSTGCYKDGTSVLLSADGGLLSYPDSAFSREISKALGKDQKLNAKAGLGFTIPIFYYQPKKLINTLTRWDLEPLTKPLYTEMEGSAVFETGRITGIQTASLVIPTDRYFIFHKELKHEFVDFEEIGIKLEVIRLLTNTFAQKDAKLNTKRF